MAFQASAEVMMGEARSLAYLGLTWTDRQPGKADRTHGCVPSMQVLDSGLHLELVIWETGGEAIKIVTRWWHRAGLGKRQWKWEREEARWHTDSCRIMALK